MNVSTRQLKAFLLVARLRNFTRAAERLHVTQAGLSGMIRELEAQLDHRLFDRTTREVALTPAGERLLPVAEAAVAGLEAAALDIGDLTRTARHVLRVAATPLVCANLLPAACAAFARSHPDVRVQLHDADLAQVAARVEGGEADIGLGFFFQPSRGLARTLLHAFPLMRVAPLAAGEAPPPGSPGRVPWSSLKGAPLIGLPADNPIQRLVDRELDRIGRAGDERPTVNHFDTLIAMVEAGLGTAVMPSLARVACRRHRVRTDLLSRPVVSPGFHRIARRGRPPSPQADAFVDTLVAMLPAMTG